MRPLGLKPALILRLYAALKRRSSTVLHAWLFPSIWLRSSLSNLIIQLQPAMERRVLL
jgi:hypothetical protein